MTANLQLFLDRFITSNKERYKDNPVVLDLLNKLTLADVVWDKIEKDSEAGSGGRVADFHSDILNFIAKEQGWICADLHNPTILTITDIKASLDEVKQSNAPGLYLYGAGDDYQLAAILDEGIFGTDLALIAVTEMVQDACLYALSDDTFTLQDNAVFISSDCIEGSVALYEKVAETTDPQEPEEPGETDPGTGTEPDTGSEPGGEGTGGDTGEENGDNGETTDPEPTEPTEPAEPEVDPLDPVTTPEMMRVDRALADPTADGVYSDVGDKGFGVLTEPRVISDQTASIAAITGATFGLVGSPTLVAENLNENA